MTESPANPPTGGPVSPADHEKRDPKIAVPVALTILTFITSGLAGFFVANIRLESRITAVETNLLNNKSHVELLHREAVAATKAKEAAEGAAQAAHGAAEDIRKKHDSIHAVAKAITDLDPEQREYLMAQLRRIAALGKTDGRLTAIEKNADGLEATVQGIELDRIVDRGKTDRRLAALETNVNSLYATVRGIDGKIGGLTVRLGSPVTVAYGSKKAKGSYTAPSAGFMILANAGSDLGSAEGGVEGPTGRVFYEVLPGTEPPERGVSHTLPAKRGDRFDVWGTQSTVTIYFVPLDVEIPTSPK